MVLAARVLLGILAVGLAAAGGAADDKKPQTIPNWGTVTDPVGDCSVKAEGDKLRITVPEGPLDLAARPAPRRQADRVVQPRRQGMDRGQGDYRELPREGPRRRRGREHRRQAAHGGV